MGECRKRELVRRAKFVWGRKRIIEMRKKGRGERGRRRGGEEARVVVVRSKDAESALYEGVYFPLLQLYLHYITVQYILPFYSFLSG